MYSGTTLTKYSGRIMGAHQKIDRIAHGHLIKLLNGNAKVFPSIKKILLFEGRNGPDGVKIKSPAQDEPWHYFNPFDDDDNQLIELINGHYDKLVAALKAKNNERVAFEAAWLAHAMVDGFTPAHHFPYEEKLVELMGGKSIETRTSVFKKNILPGDTVMLRMKNNWRMWGPKGLMTGHGLFEIGIATLIAPLTFSESLPKMSAVKHLRKTGLSVWYRQTAREIAVMDMYTGYLLKGWTPKLAWQVRHRLGPVLVSSIAVVWYSALVDAGLAEL